MSKEEICKICGVTTKQIKSHLKDWHGYVYTKDSPAYPVELPASSPTEDELRAALTRIVTDIDGCPGGEHLLSHVDDLQVLFSQQQAKLIAELESKLPKKLEIPETWRVLRPELVDIYEATNSTIDQVKALLTEYRSTS